MAKREHSYTIAYPLAEVRALVADPQAVGGALAFVEATEVSEGQVQWRLPAAMATITGAQSLLVRFEATADGARWTGRSPRLVSRGQLRLTPAGAQATSLDLSLEMAGVGMAAAVIEPLASIQIENQMDSFVDGLERALRAQATRGVVEHGNR